MGAREHIAQLIASRRVVLFMKGTRSAPQCGFSATVVDILDDYLEDYETVDVLAEPAIREGVKQHSNWPTIPQLYVGGKFVGGSDIVKEMRESGELAEVLGTGPRPFEPPEVTITETALAALAKHWDGDGQPVLRLEIDRQFSNSLYFDEARGDDVVLQVDGFTLVMDRNTARRSDGLTIDFVRGKEESGFRIDNPNEPPRVKQLSVQALSEWLEQNKPLTLLDVRTPDERAAASIEGSILLDSRGQALLESIDRAQTVVLFCHHGIRSQAAAEHLLRMGFRDVYNLAGGIEAWSREVDPAVPRY